MKLDDVAREEMMLWINTLSKPRQLADDNEAASMELEVLEGALFRSGAKTPNKIRSVFHHIKNTATHRAWPTAAEVNNAVSFLRSKSDKNREISGRGDRSRLNHDEAILLNDILCKAREWIRGNTSLREHGQQTLEFWGEK